MRKQIALGMAALMTMASLSVTIPAAAEEEPYKMVM